MKALYIDYEETGSFSPAIIRYIKNDESLKEFYNHPPTLEGFKKFISEKKMVADRVLLSQILEKQYEQIDIADTVKKNISLLKNDNTFTVTTGHQLNIFTGPLYFIFKIVSTIKLAKELKQSFPDKEFIPVYWMATEDHDFAEINHTYIHSERISWEENVSGATGRLSIATIKKALNDYQSILGFSENAQKLSSIIEKAYSLNTLADATRYLVNVLFENYGLVIIDGDDPDLKSQFTAIIEQDITQQNSFNHISEANKNLEQTDIIPQVNPREINFFYLLEGLRERITFENGKYQVLNSDISFTLEALKEEIRKYPERFSPNVVMRPLYQEVILPNLAYIGGGAEIVYWLQLKSTFEHYNIDFPVLVLRNSATISNERVDRKLDHLHFSYKDIFQSEEYLKNTWVKQNTEQELSINDEMREIECVFQKLKLRAHKIDPSLAPSTEAIQVRLEKAMKNLEKKLLKAEKRKHSQSLSNITNIKKALFPGNGLQERKENFGLFYVKYGDNFIPELLKHFNPLDFKFTILS